MRTRLLLAALLAACLVPAAPAAALPADDWIVEKGTARLTLSPPVVSALGAVGAALGGPSPSRGRLQLGSGRFRASLQRGSTVLYGLEALVRAEGTEAEVRLEPLGLRLRVTPRRAVIEAELTERRLVRGELEEVGRRTLTMAVLERGGLRRTGRAKAVLRGARGRLTPAFADHVRRVLGADLPTAAGGVTLDVTAQIGRPAGDDGECAGGC